MSSPHSDPSRSSNFSLSPLWIALKQVLHIILGGKIIYLRWLKDNDGEIAKAQRSRSRAPSWLRDSPDKIKMMMEEYRLEEELEERLAQAEREDTSSNLQAIHSEPNRVDQDDSQHTVMLSPSSSLPDDYDPQTSFGLRPAERPAHSPHVENHQTQLYLGPIGEERPLDRQAVISESRRRPVDLQLVIIISFLLVIGLVMVYSSSIVKAGVPKNGLPGDPEFFFRQQSIFMTISVVLMYVVSRIPYQLWGLTAFYAFLAGFIGLVLVFSPLGKTVNGAHRWINIGINIQPIEFMKFAWILLLSLWFGDRKQDMSNIRMFVLPLIPLSALVFLLGGQPDLGSILIVLIIFGTTYLIAGGSIKKYTPFLLGFALISISIMAIKFKHVGKRIDDYIKIFTHTEDIEYNLKQALISFCSGRFDGVGLGNSSQKEYFLPEAHTDFILTIFGAEFGFIGVFFLVVLYVLFLNRCIYIARRAHDLFGALVVTMLALIISAQAFINMAMAIGLLPTKGLTLPLISYGGSSLLITCLSIGVILNVSRAAYPSQNGLTLILFVSRFNPFPKLMRWLDQKLDPPVKERSHSERVRLKQ